jgi:aldose 1-epimerase
LLALVAACTRSTPPANEPTRVSMTPLGKTSDGVGVDVVTLRNDAGMEVRVATYGGTILSMRVPDRSGAADDIVLGFDDLATYFTKSPYFGALIGRYGNRIAKGAFTLDGTRHTLAVNNGPNHLHGGIKGWDKVVWAAEPFQRADGVGVVLKYTSRDGEEGYPGTVNADVTYTLGPTNTFTVDYHATTDKPTVINLTQHTYFNLTGAKAADVIGHELVLNAAAYTPVDDTLIPTGEIASVENTPFDFRTATPIGERIDTKTPQIEYGKGYDHNFVLTRTGAGLALAAHVVEPITGRTLEIQTTEPGVQFYSGNFLDGTLTGKGGRVYGRRSGFCLETQHYPDSPNRPNFPSTVLRPGEEYRSKTVWTFGVSR